MSQTYLVQISTAADTRLGIGNRFPQKGLNLFEPIPIGALVFMATDLI